MSRTVKESLAIEIRLSRISLEASPYAHYRTIISQTLALGYLKRHNNVSGYWIARRYLGLRYPGDTSSPYHKATIGIADDYASHGISFAKARTKAIKWFYYQYGLTTTEEIAPTRRDRAEAALIALEELGIRI